MNLRRFWRRPVTADTVPENRIKTEENRIKTETFLNVSNDTIICFICQETLPRVPEDKQTAAQTEHKRTYGHQATLLFLRENGICVVNGLIGGQLFCRICKRHLSSKESVWEHIFDVKHDEWVKEMRDLTINKSEFLTTYPISIEKFLNSKSDFAFCEVCKEDIECTPKTIRQHLSLDKHRKLFVEGILPSTGVFPIDNNIMWCKICDMRLTKNVKVLFEHLNASFLHALWFQIAETMCVRDVSIVNFLTDKKELMVKCLRCDLKITADFRKVQAHVHCESHRLRHRTDNVETVKSLALQGMWPSWCHWNFFNYLALSDSSTSTLLAARMPYSYS